MAPLVKVCVLTISGVALQLLYFPLKYFVSLILQDATIIMYFPSVYKLRACNSSATPSRSTHANSNYSRGWHDNRPQDLVKSFQVSWHSICPTAYRQRTICVSCRISVSWPVTVHPFRLSF